MRSNLLNGIAIWILLFSCARQEGESPGSAIPASPTVPDIGCCFKPSTLTMQVTDLSGTPIPQAAVFVGSGAPGTSNYQVTTDTNGFFALPILSGKQLLTVSAENWVRASFVDVEFSDNLVWKLQPKKQLRLYPISGNPLGFGTLPRDGFVDFSLMFPAQPLDQILNLELNRMISEENDIIRVALGQEVEIPANMSLPRQSETYVIPINLNKPRYRVYSEGQSKATMYALRGRFNFRQVIDKVRADQPLNSLINDFDFLSSGQVDLSIGASTVLDMPVSQTQFKQAIAFSGPQLASDEIGIAISLATIGQNLIAPQDLKTFSSKESVRLKVSQPTDAYALVAKAKTSFFDPAKKQASEPISLQWVSAQQVSNTLSLLQLISGATFNNSMITLNVPPLPSGIESAGMEVVLSEIYTVQLPGGQTTLKNPVWNFRTQDSWIKTVSVPTFPELSLGKAPANSRYRFDITLFARSANNPDRTHATQVSVDNVEM